MEQPHPPLHPVRLLDVDPAGPGAARDAAPRGAALQVLAVRQTLLPAEQCCCPPAHPHGGAPVPLLLLLTELCGEGGPDAPRPHAHGREAFPVPPLPACLRRPGQPTQARTQVPLGPSGEKVPRCGPNCGPNCASHFRMWMGESVVPGARPRLITSQRLVTSQPRPPSSHHNPGGAAAAKLVTAWLLKLALQPTDRRKRQMLIVGEQRRLQSLMFFVAKCANSHQGCGNP